jgi:hypothetical protein
METDADDSQPVSNDLLAFVSGLLLGNNTNERSWIAQYIRAGQKVSAVMDDCSSYAGLS